MIHKHICAHCGHSVGSEAIERGDLRIDPEAGVTWRGGLIHLTPAQRAIVQALAMSHVALGRSYLASAIEYRGTDPQNVINVQIHNIRRKMPGVPISTGHKQGLRWQD